MGTPAQTRKKSAKRLEKHQQLVDKRGQVVGRREQILGRALDLYYEREYFAKDILPFISLDSRASSKPDALERGQTPPAAPETRPRQYEALIEFYRKGKIAEAFRAFRKIYLEIFDEVIDHMNSCKSEEPIG